MRRQVALVLLLAVVLASAGLLFLLGSEDPRPGAEPAGPPGSGVPAAAAPAAAGGGAASSSPRVPVPVTRLRVRVVDPRGESLPEAEVLARGPAGQERTLQGSGGWEGLAVGEWSLEASLPGHFSEAAQIRLGDGEDREVALVLTAEGRIQGTVSTVFGRPVPGALVWFLPAGREHPGLPSEREELPHARTDAAGRFFSDPLRPGEYRLSVGPLGYPVFTAAAAKHLAGGATEHAELRLAQGGLVLVTVKGSTELERPVLVALLRPPFDPERFRDRPGDGWRPAAAERAPLGQPVALHRVPPGEYRLRVQATGIGRFDSTATLDVAAGAAIGLVATLPQPLPAGAGPHPLPFTLERDPPGAPEAAEAGLSWLQGTGG